MIARTFLAVAIACASAMAFAQRQDDIGYPDVGTALADLLQREDATVAEQSDWTLVRIDAKDGGATIWSFANFRHPAYPTAVKRTITGSGADFAIHTRIRCEAPAAACEAVRTEFADLERRLREHMAQDAPPPP